MVSARRVAFNLLSFVPGSGALPLVKRTLERRSIGTGGTVSARYCYSVWMRHLVHAARAGLGSNPNTVAELGPGDSLGVGVAALLTGARQYFAFDIVRHANADQNLVLFHGIRELLESCARIPDNDEFPEVRPTLDDWSFPSHILSEQRLIKALDPGRLQIVEKSIRDPGSTGSIVQYKAPWLAEDTIETDSVDMILSQAVLEHVDDLPGTYAVMQRWLRPEGYMSHVIDFRSHGWTKRWNGHWALSNFAWKVVRGQDVWSINRAPLSEHLKLLAENGFTIVSRQLDSAPSEITRQQLARRFRGMTDLDLTTPCALLIAQRR
jgi:SAM-dependent methyltransferase